MRDIISMNEVDTQRENDGYGELLAGIRQEFDKSTKDGSTPLFTTNAGDLYGLLLDGIPEEARQHYNCNACRYFVNRYGGLVKIDEKTGKQTPVMWPEKAPDFFSEAVKKIRRKVSAATVTGVFITSERQLGTPVTGSWEHMAVKVPEPMVHRKRLKNAFQEAAEKAEDYGLLASAIGKYRTETVETAVNLLRSEALYRNENVLGMAEWFLEVLQLVKEKRGARNRATRNIIWYKAATAPVGFCHISSNVIGTLLDDIAAGYDFNTVSRKFAEKMNPLQYQRPQAAPSAGNVAQAERIVEKLGIANSLKRRYARLDEIRTIWRPMPAKKAGGVSAGVFARVATKEQQRETPNAMSGPTVTITWEKFRRTVLGSARKIEFYVPGKEDCYTAILTAEDQEAPPIILWDAEENRNPFSWYVYSGGSAPSRWNLLPGYVEVTGVTLQPNLWQPGYEYRGASVIFILKGAKDRDRRSTGLALFPEVLKSELHEVRSTIEAYSKSEKLGGADEASACGVRLQKGLNWNAQFRVTTDIGTTIYKLDRWD
ncbi:hypothetical protein NE539_01820 [Flavonifractor plautii]|uniref:hypothetical protein n=1 Tax=Flavonifractor plautii TaxID=292800 RepID=UPI00210D1490|nr:hypothetical protein [Flavonifractor plautii]MCQ4992036.1 hypothetical protein [Flavonifractor plautii]